MTIRQRLLRVRFFLIELLMKGVGTPRFLGSPSWCGPTPMPLHDLIHQVAKRDLAEAKRLDDLLACIPYFVPQGLTFKVNVYTSKPPYGTMVVIGSDSDAN